MENKMYNQPAYNTEYNAVPGGVQVQPGGYPSAPPAYSADGYNTNYSGYGAPAPVGGYYVQPQAAPVPVISPPPVGFVSTTGNDPNYPTDANQAEGATNFGASFSDKNIRRVFVRKVYSILLLQLLFTFGIVAIFIFVDKVKFYVQNNLGIYWASYAVFLVTYITLACCPTVRRRYPANIICLAIFTMALSYMTGTISSFYDTQVVFIAAGICAGVCLGITLLSMWSKFDITGCGIYLAVASFVLFFFGLFAIFTYNSILYTVYSSLFALLMMFFLAYDTQMIMGGKRHELSPEEHIIAALNLYLDIVYIFLILLSLVGRGK